LLAGLLAELGADRSLRVQALAAHSAAEVLRLAQAAGLPLADQVAARARAAALAVLAGGTVVEVLVFDREGALLGRA
jgi:cobalt-precorrin-5B (C1)-methyltransferase